jgi:Uma2 family endonuclease
MSTKTLITVEEFGNMHFPDTEDYELVDGELIPLSSGTYRHNKTRDLIGHVLWSYFQRKPIGEAVGENDCRVAEGKIRRPDLSVFLAERLRQIDLDKIPAPIAPDIAVEVLSPSEGVMETRGKVREYLSAGSAEVWLIDHANREVQIHTQGGIRVLQGTDVLETPVLPGFGVPVADLGMNP